jgi:hypothetical protein
MVRRLDFRLWRQTLVGMRIKGGTSRGFVLALLVLVGNTTLHAHVVARGHSEAELKEEFRDAKSFEATGQIDMAEACYERLLVGWSNLGLERISPEVRKKLRMCRSKITELEKFRAALAQIPEPTPKGPSFRFNGQNVYLEPL